SALFLFFFSSRRRHTTFSRDWSSDVCSSDLVTPSTPFRCDFGLAYRATSGSSDFRQVQNRIRAMLDRLLHSLRELIRSKLKRCLDRKSTRLNSSHVKISYAVFCLKKKT